MKIYPKDKKTYILYLYGPPCIMQNVFNYKSYIQRLIRVREMRTALNDLNDQVNTFQNT